MSYYDTFEEDVTRAKEILAEDGETILGKDIYAAYKLLESFVAEFERQRGRATARLAERRAQEAEGARLLAEGWTPITTAAEAFARYGDRDAADRLQRGIMYLDIGYLAGQIDKLEAELASDQTSALRHLATAMKKVLPPWLFTEVLAHCDPLTPFLEALKVTDAKLGTAPHTFTEDQIRELRQTVTDGAGHECDEWWNEDGACLLCDRKRS